MPPCCRAESCLACQPKKDSAVGNAVADADHAKLEANHEKIKASRARMMAADSMMVADHATMPETPEHESLKAERKK